jgi:hypothetical protein
MFGIGPTPVKALIIFEAREAFMIERQLHEADCAEIQEQLAVQGGRALSRGLRHHVEHCAGCRAFATEVRRQKAALGVLLAVAPSPALKHRIVTGASAAAGNDAATVSATAARNGGGGAARADGAGVGGEAAGGA